MNPGWIQKLAGEETRISLCCNDPDNGRFDGRCSGIEWNAVIPEHGTAELSFEPNHIPGPALTVDHEEKTLRLCRVSIPFHGYQAWVGNWCWDEFRVKSADLERLLTSRSFLQSFSPDQGDTILWTAWETATNQPIPTAE